MGNPRRESLNPPFLLHLYKYSINHLPPFTRNKIFHKHFATLLIPSNEKKFEKLQILYISHEKSVMWSHRNRQENVFNVSSSIARSKDEIGETVKLSEDVGSFPKCYVYYCIK